MVVARWKAWLAAALFVLLGAASPSAAQVPAAPVVVKPGDSAILDRGPKPFENVRASKGAAASAASGTTPNSYALVYFPPQGATDLDDLIQYTAGGENRAIPVSVQTQAPTLTGGDLYSRSFKALFVLFVLAILVENGLALLFRWRLFLSYFDTRSVNPLVAFGLSLAFVLLFRLDVTTGLLNVYAGENYPANWPGMVLTAMIIAGGSGGVNRIFQALGFRSVIAPEQATARPPPGQAWVAVKLGPASTAVGTVDVLIGPQATPAVAGTIDAGAGALSRLLGYFVRDRRRFPQSGGYGVPEPGRGPYEIRLVGRDARGNPVTAAWGPYELAPGALVDVSLAPR